MKPLLLLSLLAAPLFLSACEVGVVSRYPHRSGYVGRGDYDHRSHTRPDQRETVVVSPRSSYRPKVEVRYYRDARCRYYYRDGRRVYTNAGVHY